jgi:S-formylglutathione hydrolase FrmB
MQDVMTEPTTLLRVPDPVGRSAVGIFRSQIAVVIYFAAILAVAPVALSRSMAAPPQDASLTPSAIPWVTRAVSAHRVVQRTFQSAAAKTAVSYHLYLPAAYDREPGRRFPVAYWLHGSGGGLAGIPAVARRFDEAIQTDKTPPCLVVFVNGLEMGMYVDWSNGAAPVETVIVRDLVSHIDATYRTVAAREGRLLDGFSMGGYGAARFGFKYPEMFRAISIVGAGPLQETLTSTPRASKVRAEELLARVYGGSQARFRQEGPRTLAKANAMTIAKGSLVRMVIGSSDETYENNAAFHDSLELLKIPHEWIVLKGVGHDPEAVLKALGDANWSFYRKAFGAS